MNVAAKMLMNNQHSLIIKMGCYPLHSAKEKKRSQYHNRYDSTHNELLKRTLFLSSNTVLLQCNIYGRRPEGFRKKNTAEGKKPWEGSVLYSPKGWVFSKIILSRLLVLSKDEERLHVYTSSTLPTPLNRHLLTVINHAEGYKLGKIGGTRKLEVWITTAALPKSIMSSDSLVR